MNFNNSPTIDDVRQYIEQELLTRKLEDYKVAIMQFSEQSSSVLIYDPKDRMKKILAGCNVNLNENANWKHSVDDMINGFSPRVSVDSENRVKPQNDYVKQDNTPSQTEQANTFSFRR
jgi:Zn-finger domain-containing protein